MTDHTPSAQLSAVNESAAAPTAIRLAGAQPARGVAEGDRERQQHKWRDKHYDVEAVRDMQTPWARDAADGVDSRNAALDPRAAPTLTLRGDELVILGATDAELRQLTPLSPIGLRDLREQSLAIKRATELRVGERAKLLRAAEAAAEVALPPRVDLARFTPPVDAWVIGDLLAPEGVLGLFAERKAGKSAVVRELARAAVDGVPFLGRYAVELDDDAEVVLLDTEMPTATLWRQFRRAEVGHLDRINLRALRGCERSLDVRVDAVRRRWSTAIEPGSLIVLDCLYALLGALGVSENSDEVVPVLAGLRALAKECEAAGLVIVHHLGKNVDRGARGHSSIEGFPDVIARIELDGALDDGPRTFSAFGRDVSVAPAALVMDDRGRLTLGASPSAERAARRHATDDDAVARLIERHPGLSVRTLYLLPVESRGKLSRDRIRESVDRLALVRRVTNKGTEASPAWHIASVDPLGFDADGAA